MHSIFYPKKNTSLFYIKYLDQST